MTGKIADELQVELIDLQEDDSLKHLFETKCLIEVYASPHHEKFNFLAILSKKCLFCLHQFISVNELF